MIVKSMIIMLGSSMILAQVSNSLDQHDMKSLSKLVGVTSLSTIGVATFISIGAITKLLIKL
ncbi:hypothetical protein U729_3236 (plasmid) [Clostridium baratii str. Sullivan]|uniref:Uncharacterized protein n=1 Tax=Clostridium baratii str. Sullivan TaxID=1415775 RepID=A0A0A7G0M9_9CLOT|nr:hypothetical protein [Clostridium baratii]AIY85393.1 hypothetical protein U729_3236 [Clostridium baratii str. Sullivan]